MTFPFLDQLNKEQREAVTHTLGPSIILAGAGSGKTRVLTYKAMYLIESGAAAPDEILMLTFTNKAAAEMKKRILNTIDLTKKPEFITAQTFHSFCASTLRRNGRPDSGDRDFTILDTDDQKDLLKDIIIEHGKSSSLKPGTLLYAISEAKNKLVSPHDLLEQSRDFFQEQIAKLYGQYQKRLQEVRGIDFDDLLMETVQLITENTKVRLYFQNRFKQVLVDEYQDTNHAQYLLAKLLSEKRRNITIVGDFSQSIYSWRGADFHNLEKFKTDFEDAITFHLEQNYRSTQPILDVAFQIISKNETHPILKLWTNKKKGEEIHIMSLENAEEEALYIVNKIRTLKEMESIPLSEIAILYRTNAQSRLFEEVCLHLGIPYKIFGGTRFYERKEVKDVLAFVRYLKNDSDATALKRIYSLGKRRAEKVLFAISKLKKDEKPGEILQTLLNNTPYLDLYDEHDPEDSPRLENIKELVSVAYSFTTLNDFLDSVALIESGYELPVEDVDRLNMMTLHAAKGLEFDAVFLPGLEEGLLPHSRSTESREELEEERRLLYVGVTRARKFLYITYAARRAVYGRYQYTMPSQFLTESGLVESKEFF